MNIRLAEKSSLELSTSGSITSATYRYYVTDLAATETLESALLALKDTAPEEVGSATLDKIALESCDAGSHPSQIVFRAEYRSSNGGDTPGSGDSQTLLSFSCGGGTRHVTTAISQRATTGAPNAGKFVNWNGKAGDDCQVNGVDVPAANMTETYTKTMAVSALTTAWRRKVAALVGTVNSGTFKGWQPGEMRFDGVTFNEASGSSTVSVGFNFTISPNEQDVDVAGKTISKEGHEYVWALSETTIPSGESAPALVTKGVYVAKVMKKADFGSLGI